MANKTGYILKNGLLVIIFMILFTPFIVGKITDHDFFALKGGVTNPSNVQFSKRGWITGSYQQEKEEYLNSMFSLRNLFLRLNNQITFSLFNMAKANGVVIGKENYLYEIGYIDAYTGKNFIGENNIAKTVNTLKFVSDTLNKLGKHLVIIFAPGKASFYPEYIPDSYLPAKEKTNYKSFSNQVKNAGLNMIDFNKWFMDNKTTSKYPLYPQFGVHWSSYGTALASDSIIKKIEYIMHIDAPNMQIVDVKMSQPFDADRDIIDGLNIFKTYKSFEMAYPVIKTEDIQGKTKPKVLVISDSFYWGLYNSGIANSFQDSHFWYYNKQVFPETATKELLTDNLNLADEINKHDVFIIMSTEATLNNIGWGFIEKAGQLFNGNKNALNTGSSITLDQREKMTEAINYIKSNAKWMEDVRVRAKEKNVSIDSMLVIEAIWQINNN